MRGQIWGGRGRRGTLALLWLFAAGCSAGGNTSGSGGGGGAGAGPGATGNGGTAGSLCPASAGATGGMGPDGLPFCPMATRPLDPLNADAAVDARTSSVPNTANDDDNCNQLQTSIPVADGAVLDCLRGPLCPPEPFDANSGVDAGDGGGATLDSGVGRDGGVLSPAGGTLVDGDYQLVRYRSNQAGVPAARRTIGLFDGATYVEWATGSNASDQILRLNTTMRADGSSWTVVTVNCGSLATTGYGYTANGTELDLYDRDANGRFRNVYTYQRTCSR